MEVVEFTPERSQFVYTFGGAEPVMRVRPGTALKLWSEDAFNHALRSVDDVASKRLDVRYLNPQTGPFYIVGAEPGDTLAVHLVSLSPA
ncbi:MAG: acetamidase/formamidase family protein, partial [Microbacteriaceae bacterium]